jgi:MOSC domain-containing protein YiiM
MGIARHDRPKGAMETLQRVAVTAAEGVRGDYRGRRAAAKPGRRHQVSLIEAGSLARAMDEAGAVIEWFECRRNLLVDGLRFPREPGFSVAIGASLVIEVVTECEPCARMDGLHPGLFAALVPDWRGGFRGRVVADGEICLGDEVRIV